LAVKWVCFPEETPALLDEESHRNKLDKPDEPNKPNRPIKPDRPSKPDKPSKSDGPN
jgi:hypothetical protein